MPWIRYLSRYSPRWFRYLAVSHAGRTWLDTSGNPDGRVPNCVRIRRCKIASATACASHGNESDLEMKAISGNSELIAFKRPAATQRCSFEN